MKTGVQYLSSFILMLWSMVTDCCLLIQEKNETDFVEFGKQRRLYQKQSNGFKKQLEDSI